MQLKLDDTFAYFLDGLKKLKILNEEEYNSLKEKRYRYSPLR